jgi:hypothetical protein
MKTSSEARSICHTDRLLLQPGSGMVRMPISTLGLDQQRNPADRAAVDRVDGAGRTARIVAVEAVPQLA